ncbi:hypothetical protein PT974_05080 [Cladobotryum mycophilum]|uniref:Uncharacterized protein n=1 Tax=Cladobotryum mycophilum TaxID=491253 RepID=A0ABR0SR01_9HYPO
MTSGRAFGMKRWMEDGLLLPYGHPRDDFDTLNPLFFQDEEKFPPGAIAEPLSEWPMELLDCAGGRARNDVYGKMFYYVRNMFFKFHQRIKTLSLAVGINSKDFRDVPNFLLFHSEPQQFDRIELGTLWDRFPHLCHVVFTKLLRHQDENPFATMLAMTRESVSVPVNTNRELYEKEQLLLHAPSGTELDEYAPPLGDKDITLKSVLRRQLGLVVWRNWDQFADLYHKCGETFDFIARDKQEEPQGTRSVILKGHLGFQLRAKNTITPRWPNRLVYNKTSRPTLREFNRWIGWANVMPERWLEWKKIRDVKNEELDKWLKIAFRDINEEDEATSDGEGPSSYQGLAVGGRDVEDGRDVKCGRDAEGGQDSETEDIKKNDDSNGDMAGKKAKATRGKRGKKLKQKKKKHGKM